MPVPASSASRSPGRVCSTCICASIATSCPKNLGATAGSNAAVAALVEAAGPSRRAAAASFASRAYAFYALAEGPPQPRGLAAAFLRPVDGDDLGESSRDKLIEFRRASSTPMAPARSGLRDDAAAARLAGRAHQLRVELSRCASCSSPITRR